MTLIPVCDNAGKAWNLSRYPELPTNLLRQRGSNKWIVDALPILGRIQSALGVSLQRSGDDIEVNLPDVRFRLRCWEEAYITGEIFVNKEYGLDLPGPYSVMDVGGNCGLAALEFARRTNVAHVYSYELVPETAEVFADNLAMNGQLQSKITLERFGLSDKDAELKIDYDPRMRGSVGLHGVGVHARDSGTASRMRKVTVRVRDVATVAREIFAKAPDRRILLKLDCEGAEYSIINRLKEASLLSQFSGAVIEWHVRGPEEISRSFKQAGFAVWSAPHDGASHGMIYAVKSFA